MYGTAAKLLAAWRELAGPNVSSPRPWTAGLVPGNPRWSFRGTRGDRAPVLLHHGFLIEGNGIWGRSGIADSLRRAERQLLQLDEHALREVSPAHALGHDPNLLLADTLAAVVDLSGADEVDVVASGEGSVPALILALNDDRVRHLVLLDPSLSGAEIEDHTLHLNEQSGPTLTEIDLGLECRHPDVQLSHPAPSVRWHLDWVFAPTLVLTAGNCLSSATQIEESLPRATMETFAESSLAILDPRCADTIAWYLAS